MLDCFTELALVTIIFGAIEVVVAGADGREDRSYKRFVYVVAGVPYTGLGGTGTVTKLGYG